MVMWGSCGSVLVQYYMPWCSINILERYIDFIYFISSRLTLLLIVRLSTQN